jgi:ferredoxin
VAVSIRLVVDPIACDGHGVCAEVFPEGIVLDDWGYPILRPGDVPVHLESHARRAASACPVLALKVRRSHHR